MSERPRPSRWHAARRAGVLIALLFVLLGFALAVQVRSTQSSALSSAREEDLVRILDDLSARESRLRSEINDLQAARERINSGTDRADAALQEARKRADELEILAGTAPARGPGIVVTVTDGTRPLPAEVLLDSIEELRGAGAEAIQIDGVGNQHSVRVGVSTWFVDANHGVELDGTTLQSPYRITAIGDGPTMAAAMNIPGGVVDTIRQAGGAVRIEQRGDLRVTALRRLLTPQYARSAK